MVMIIAIGAAKLRHWWDFPEFALRSVGSLKQARSAEGCLHAETFVFDGHYCSLTAWQNRQAMKAYVSKGAHKGALKMAHKLTESSGFRTFPAKHVPSAAEAMRILSEPRRPIGADSGGKSPPDSLIPRANLQE